MPTESATSLPSSELVVAASYSPAGTTVLVPVIARLMTDGTLPDSSLDFPLLALSSLLWARLPVQPLKSALCSQVEDFLIISLVLGKIYSGTEPKFFDEQDFFTVTSRLLCQSS